jgi:RNA recognition motif-containing protein
MRIFVGNLNFRTTEQELRSLFFEYGTVEAVSLPTDRETGQARGFAFIDMPNQTEAEAAISALNGTEWGGRNLNVNEARPKSEGGGGGRQGGGGGGFDRGRSGGGGGGQKRRW